MAMMVCAALLQGGCNLIISTRPAFTQREAATGLSLKPGYRTGPGCTADLVALQTPDCPLAVTITASTLRGKLASDKSPMLVALVAQPATYLLVQGNPAIIQVGLGYENEPPDHYVFAGIRPLARDAEGRITELEFWPAFCGPPRAREPEWPDGFLNSQGVMVQPTPPPADTLFPGLKTNGDTVDRPGCSFKNPKAVRGSVAASDGLDSLFRLHWDREAAE